MLQLDLKKILPVFETIRYVYRKDVFYDYSQSPRPCHNLVFLTDGEGEIRTNSKDGALSFFPKQILFIPQGTTYECLWKARPKCVFFSVHFNFAPTLDPFAGKIFPVQLLKTDVFDEAYALVLETERSRENDNAFSRAGAFFKLCELLLKDLSFAETDENYSRILPAIDYLKQHPNVSCKVETLAKLCYVSLSYFHYLFKKATGLSPVNYKNRLIVNQAAQTLLLEKDVTAESVAEAYGFDDVVYFRRLFKKVTGKTPSEYRKKGQLL